MSRALGLAGIAAALGLAACATRPAASDSAASADTTTSMVPAVAPVVAPVDTTSASPARVDSAAPAVRTTPSRTEKRGGTKASAAGAARDTSRKIGRDSAVEVQKGRPLRTFPEVPPAPARQP